MNAVGSSPRARVVHARSALEALIEQYRRSGHDRLPPETELSAELQVSRNTLREALARLETEGVIVRKRRVGTVIVSAEPAAAAAAAPAAPLIYPIDAIVSIPDFLTGQDRVFEIEWVTVRQERADQMAAERLGLPVGAEVYRVRRKYTLEDGPVAIGEHLIPKVLRDHGIHIEALTDGVSTFLTEVEHISVDTVEHVVGAISADAALAKDLETPLGAPLLSVEALLHTKEEDGLRPLAVGKLIFNPSKIAVRATGHA